MAVQGRNRRRGLALLGGATLTSGDWSGLALRRAEAASPPAPVLTLRPESRGTRVTWRFAPLASRAGSALDLDRREGAGAWVRIAHRDRPRPSGSLLDRHDGTGLFSYRARLTAPA